MYRSHLSRLARGAAVGAACLGLLIPAGPVGGQAAPHLRPSAMVSLRIPGLRLIDATAPFPDDGQDGWVASLQQQTTAPHRYRFVLQQAGTTHIREYVLAHAAPATDKLPTLVVADSRWFVWYQAAHAGPSDWQLVAHNMRTGSEWVVDTARAEGALDASCNFAVDGDTFVWTSSNRLTLQSRVYVVDLATHRRVVLGTTHSPLFYEQPATDGRHVVWTYSRYVARTASVTSTLQAYDLQRHRQVRLHIGGDASMPVVGYGAVAWSNGTDSHGPSTINAESLQTGRQYHLRVTGDMNPPSIGPCTVGIAAGGGVGGLWDYCTGSHIELVDSSTYQMNGYVFRWHVLAGQYLYMGAIREIGGYQGHMDPNHGPWIAVFHLSTQHPVYDFYH